MRNQEILSIFAAFPLLRTVVKSEKDTESTCEYIASFVACKKNSREFTWISVGFKTGTSFFDILSGYSRTG